MDNSGMIVNEWKRQYKPGQSVYLLENSHRLRCCLTKNKAFIGVGEVGRFEERDRNGNIVWTYGLSDDENLMHHDISPMPNGNTLICSDTEGHFFEVTPDCELVWEYITPASAPPATTFKPFAAAEKERRGARTYGLNRRKKGQK